jgi:hypothetical protein
VDERNRLLLTAECHIKKDKLEFPFIFSRVLIKSQLKACIHTPENICITLYIILSTILQLSGVLCLIGGIKFATVTAASDFPNEETKTGNFKFCYQ